MPPIDPELQKKLSDLEIDLRKAQLSIEAQKKELVKAESDSKEKAVEAAQLKTEMAALVQENLKLKSALNDVNKARPMMEVGELARQLRETVLTLNSEAKQKSKEGMLVDQFEVEIKGGLDVTKGIRLVQLQPQELSPQSVSTFRFALQRVPTVRIADDSTQNG